MSDNRVNQPYTTKGSRVTGKGYSYNCTSKIDAERLCQTLNQYEHDIKIEQNISKQYDKIQKQLIQIEMSIKILEDETKTLRKLVEQW